jgi:uncharacterized pyridoxal phosphate-containing UPF0001 family protein
VFGRVLIEKQREIAEKFDSIHSVQRARQVGSLDEIIEPAALRPSLIAAVEAGLKRHEAAEKELQPPAQERPVAIA